MTSLDFVTRLSSTLKIKRVDMVEKDVILHQILTDLSNDGFFSKNFLLKGGTCLIKHYLGYFRFSEDADFTWRDQSRFRDKTAKEIRKELSPIINRIGKILEQISSSRGFDFKCLKNNMDYVEIGGSNKMCTFKMWYYSTVLKKRFFIKIQVNFIEEMCTKSNRGQLKSLAMGDSDEMSALFPEYVEYSKIIPFDLYDVSDILSEKVRALITRRGFKTRDLLDVFFIQKDLCIKPAEIEKCIIKKTEHAIHHYSKYRDNLKAKANLMEKETISGPWDARTDLLLTPVNEREFQKFETEFTKYLEELIKKLR